MSGIFPKVNRIVAIGDIHGDIIGLKKILKKAGLIEENGLWIGGNTYVVQVGDQMDGLSRLGNWKKDNEMEVLLYMTELDNEAKKFNGRVLSLIGNHELMNTMGEFSYVSSNGINQFGGSEKRLELCRPGGRIAQLLAQTRYAIVKIGDWVFVHGGVIPEISGKYKIPYINTIMRNYLNNKLKVKEVEHFREIFDKNDSIVYYRGYSNEKPNCKSLEVSLQNLKAKRMVVGHTVQPVINSKCSNKIWRIDTGISRAFGSGRDLQKRNQYMEILDNYLVKNY